MPIAPSFSEAELTRRLAEAEAARAQAEAGLAAAQARIAALEQAAATNAGPSWMQPAQLEALVQHQRVGLVLVDDDGLIQYVNPHFWQLLGLAPPSGHPPFAAADFQVNAAFRDPGAFSKRAWAIHAAGQTVCGEEFDLADARKVELDYLVPAAGRAGRLICYRDVTSRHQQARHLRQLMAVPEHNPNPILRLDATGEVRYANPAAAPLVAALATAATGTGRAAVLRLVQAARQGEPTSQPLELAGRHYEVKAAAVPDEDCVTLYFTDITEHQQAGQQLARQQAFYESILAQLPMEVAVYDADNRYLFANPAAVPDAAARQQVLGRSNHESEALLGLPADVAAQRAQYFELAARTRLDVTWEEMQTSRTGRPRLTLRHLRPVANPDGTLRVLVGSGIDITARYLAEQLLQQGQEKLLEQQTFIRQVVDALPSLVYLTAPDGTILFSNQGYEEVMAEERRVGRDTSSPVVREEMHSAQAFNAEVNHSQRALSREMRYTTRDGNTRYYDVFKRPMRQAGGQPAVLSIATDVTDRKMARQELERREKQYHDLIYYSQALICTHDLQGQLLTVNPAIEHLLGWPAAELVGHSLGKVLPPSHAAEFRAYLADIGHRQSHEHLMTVQTRTGERRYLRYLSYQVREAGAVPYVVASGYDVTAGVLAQRALQQAKHEAEENARAKEAFLAHMSHEIRTPLNGVLGMVGLLQRTPLSESQQAYLNTMQVAGRHLLTLVNDVLDMTKITTHHLELEHLPFDLRPVLEGTGETVAALAAQHGLALLVCPPAAGYRLVGDAYRLRQVLLNLLGNALKFTERGHVELGAEVLDEAPAAAPGAVVLRCWVADTGIGMSPAEQAHIFEAFAQASADTSRRYGGTGLGLTISQLLVEQMGGVLQVHSAPGEGTTFSFVLLLPRDEAPVAAPDSRPAATYEALRGRRVLLAEDNLLNQQIAAAVLEHWGVEVQAVSNGLDALAQLRENTFDAALLDIRMPGLNGVEVATAIRAHPAAEHANLPIIALTANAFENERIAYLAAGMNACLTKPYEEAALCELLLALTTK